MWPQFKTAVACSAVHLPELLSPFPANRSARPDRFVYLVNGMSRHKLLRKIWPVLRGSYRGDEHLTGYARQLRVRCQGGYVVDGELLEKSDDTTVVVDSGPELTFRWPRADESTHLVH